MSVPGYHRPLGLAPEEMVWHGARLANPTLMDYKVPTTLDAPDEIYPIVVEAPGKRFHALPLTPERVRRAMLGK